MAEDNEHELQEMQILDQNLHNILLQKQAFELELSETTFALAEIEKSGEIFRLVGDLMMKADKQKVKESLVSKEKILSMRIKSVEKQEDAISKRLDELRNKFSKFAK
ncbi:MAG TPA: prefoldin subunit [Candidatus Omnitrophota bacterium]|nr:prefoldin subunit [Candidatus Omnitrophota bacterium]